MPQLTDCQPLSIQASIRIVQATTLHHLAAERSEAFDIFLRT